MRSGELFAGVGGLGMAVDEVFGSSPAWFAEFDAAPSKVLAHHFPDVPNYGDVRAVDFRSIPHTQVRSGGFPCQDVSLAGRRRGMTGGTRSGLWTEFARSIEEDRPDWVVIENVRGLLSADASVDMEPCPLCVGDNPEHVLRALGAVLGDLANLGFDAEWTGIRASDVGAPHGRFRVFILAWPSAHTRSDESERWGRQGDLASSTRASQTDGEEWKRDGNAPGYRSATTTVDLLPTPGAYQPGGSQHPDKRRAGGHALNLQDVAEHLPPIDWGSYAEAVSRWASLIGRPTPAPVRNDGKDGRARLNPELTEWMMGWPAGWVTAPEIGLSRAEQLKACGNGVVPQQAAAALRMMLARPGVPSREQVAA